MNQTELLLPCGNITMAQAAIHNGANAIYVGMPGFNARGRTHDHSLEELQEIIELCHLYDVHVHVAFNILIFQSELKSAVEMLKRVLALSPDALIVQDLGIVNIIKSIAPKQVIHGSTQMTVTNHEAIELLEDLDIKRFVLGRENSLEEIAIIKKNTKRELEVFVHGALCVAYSGQCFTSESLGGRSANRGQCAQSCRFEYELYVDDEKKELLDKKFLVSPKDLCGINDVHKLVQLGVESFKVEGRLKSAEFVASVASTYRKAINDNLVDQNKVDEMALTFSRGFYNGWMDGVAHQSLVDGSFGSNRGLEVGLVSQVNRDGVFIISDKEIRPGDGLFIQGLNNEFGASVYGVQKVRDKFEVKFSKELKLDNIERNSRVFINSRDSLSKDLIKSFTDKTKLKRLPLHLDLKMSIGNKAILEATVLGQKVIVKSHGLCEKSKTSPLDKTNTLKTLSGLSHSPYIVASSTSYIEKNLFLNNKELKMLKQEMVKSLNNKRLQRESLIENSFEFPKRIDRHGLNLTTKEESKLTILIRTLEQCTGLIRFLESSGYKHLVRMVILDYEFGKDFVKSVKLLRDHSLYCAIATTRILKPNEYHNFTLIKRANPNGILVRNLGALNYFNSSEFDLYGDFSLNVSNSLTFNYLLKKGLKTVCLSYDLNNKNLNDLLDHVDTSSCEITAHQYMPEFHMEHCVYAAFLSKGNSFRDCGKPCEKHEVHLKDMFGNRHEIKADQECRNTMYNSNAMSAASLVPGWQEKGVTHFRFEALHETSDDLNKKIEVYLKLISGDIDASQSISEINVMESYGVGTGQLLNSHTYKDKKQVKK